MVILYLHVVAAIFLPNEAYPPLPVDADGVLSHPIPRQGFQPIPRRYIGFGQCRRRIKNGQFLTRRFVGILGKPLWQDALVHRKRQLVPDAFNHLRYA